MQRETKRIDPYESSIGTGVIGRMADALTGKGHNVGSFSVDRFSVALVGQPGVTTAPMIVEDDGISEFHLEDLESMIGNLHNNTPHDSGFFGEMWSDALMAAVDTNKLLAAELDNVATNTTFPDSYLSRQLETVARLIETREARGVDTDIFYVEIGGMMIHSIK